VVGAFFASLILLCKRHTLNRRRALREFATYALISGLTVLLVNPYYVLNWDGFLATIQKGIGNQVFNDAPFWAPYQLSWFVLLLFCGVAAHQATLVRSSDFSVLSLACALPAAFVYAATGHIMAYVYCGVALLSIMSAVSIVLAFRWLTGFAKWATMGIVTVLFLVFPVGRSAYYVQNYTAERREAAGAWINEHVEPGLGIGLYYPPRVWDAVPFRFQDYKLVDFRRLGPGQELPDYLLLSAARPPEDLAFFYELAVEFLPSALLGYHYELAGETHALIAKTIRIYRLSSGGLGDRANRYWEAP
jgi:hypothetical protein